MVFLTPRNTYILYLKKFTNYRSNTTVTMTTTKCQESEVLREVGVHVGLGAHTAIFQGW